MFLCASFKNDLQQSLMGAFKFRMSGSMFSQIAVPNENIFPQTVSLSGKRGDFVLSVWNFIENGEKRKNI